MAQAAYISADEVAESFDTRIIKQLSSYSGSPQSDVDNSVTTNAIEKASAEVESFALRGGLYTTTNLSDLQTADDWSLKGLMASLTMKHLFRGKGTDAPPDIVAMIGEATETLNDLRDGKRVFNLSTVHDAAKAAVKIVNITDRGRMGMISDGENFPNRQDQVI